MILISAEKDREARREHRGARVRRRRGAAGNVIPAPVRKLEAGEFNSVRIG